MLIIDKYNEINALYKALLTLKFDTPIEDAGTLALP